MNDTLKLIIGDMPPSQFVAAFLLALLGAFLSTLMKANERPAVTIIKGTAVATVQTAWSWKHLWNDNTKKLVMSFILIYVAIRFAPEVVGTQVTMWVAFGIGFGLDKISQVLKTMGALGQKPPEVKEKTQDLKEVATIPPNPPIS